MPSSTSLNGQRNVVSARLAALWPPAVLCILAIWLANRSWRRWSDILVDFGNELYVPWRLAEGDALYRDLFFVMGPASQYANALLFRLCGVSLTTLIVANFAIVGVLVLFLYRLFVRAGDRLSATVVCAFFLIVFGFAQYSGTGNYNYICPYRHEMTHGLCLCVMQIFCLVKFAEHQSRWSLFFAGLCSGLLASMKIELFVASTGVCAVAAAILTARERPSTRELLEAISVFSIAFAIPISVCLGILSLELRPLDAAQAMFHSWTLAARPDLSLDYPLFALLMGIDDPMSGVLRVVLSFLALLVLYAVAVGLDGMSRRLRRHRWLMEVILGSCVFSTAYFLVPIELWLRIGFPLPLFVAVAGASFVRLTLQREQPDAEVSRNLFLCLWSVLSGLLLLKMVLNVQLGHYGFVLAMPTTLLLVYCATYYVPDLLKQRRGTGDAFRAMALGVVLACAGVLAQRSGTIYQRKTEPIGAAGDLTYHDPTSNYRSALMPFVLDDLQEMMPEDSTLMALPYGVQLNYLLRRRNPTPYFLLTPWEMSAAGGEGRVLESMQQTPPDFIVLVDAEIVGHGFTRFGQPGYGSEILEWIDDAYHPVRVHVGTDRPSRAPFRAIIYKRGNPPG